ncbi:uncharacterized protein FFMR_09006 [Fusarium fujikuroi]|nr:uncharacterized protein FFC1_05096 [Fusarium fujikuroi]SCO48097.1 uncharacterized protein FFMR_09006 [Fusarium fujikuroi]
MKTPGAASYSEANNNSAHYSLQINAPTNFGGSVSISINTDSYSELLKSIDPYNFNQLIEERSTTRVPGTCEWILKQKEFQDWHSMKEQTFWIFGNPGSGKTFIADRVRSHLEGGRSVLMYFFFASKMKDDNTLEKFYRTCLHQLLCQVPRADQQSVLDLVNEQISYNQYKSYLVVNAIKKVLERLGSGYLVIDAIDECPSSKGVLSNWLKDLAEIPRLQIMITSRPSENMESLAHGNIQLRLSSVVDKSNEDIKLYVRHRLGDINQWNYMKKVEEEVMSRSKGMILYARVMLDRLERTTGTEEAMLKELERMPPDLSKIYAQKLKGLVGIESTGQLIRNVFRWIAVSKRPPSVSDLWVVHNIQQTSNTWDPFECEEKGAMDQRVFRDILGRHCLPLVEITSNGDSVQFIHATVLQFLEGKTIETDDDERCPTEFCIDDLNSHDFASLTCVSYLQLDHVRLKGNRPGFLNIQSFRDYTVMNWERHYLKSHERGLNFVVSFCCNPAFETWVDHRAKLDRAFRVQFAVKPGSVYPTPLHVTIYFGLLEVARSSFMNMVNHLDAAGSTPLHIAATQSSAKFVEGLLGANARLDVADSNGSLPLHRAVRHGNYEAAKILVKQQGAGITASDKFGFTPLAISCQLGWKKCTEVLLKEFELQHDVPKTAIGLAVENCHYPIVQRFLEWDETLIEHCKEPLLQAARRGQTDMVKFLVQKGVDLSYRDRHKQTVLHKACISGKIELAGFLLGLGEETIAPDPIDGSGRTPLYFAAERGHIEIVNCLIENQANVNSLDRRSETPLFKPAGNGHLAVVERLLDAGTDATRLDNWQRTPLLFAAMKGRYVIAKTLLERTNIQQDIPDWRGLTVLQNAAQNLREGQEDIINLLIDHGAQPDKLNAKTGGTALHEALHRLPGHPPPSEALIRRLVQVGVPINKLDGAGRSPLFYASLSRNSTIVKVLLDGGAKDETPPLPMWHGQLLLPVNIETQSAMHIALLSGDDGFLSAILETNWGRSAITRRDGNGRTVIHLAAYFGLDGHLSLLLDHVSDHMVTTVDIPDAEGRTALHLAARQGHLSVVRRLLHFGALAYCIDAHRFMPVHLAAEAGHLKIVSDLLDTLPAQIKHCLDAWDRCLPNSSPSHDDGVELAFLETLCKVGALIPIKWPERFGVVPDAWNPGNRANLTDQIVSRLQSWDQERHSFPSTLLMRAVFGGHVDVVKLVLRRIPDMPLQAENYTYPNALTLAAAHGHAEIAALLIEAGSIVDAVTDGQDTALHQAAEHGHADVIEVLLNTRGSQGSKPPNPDLPRLRDGSTPLHLAAQGGHDDAVRALAHVAFLNSVDDLGRTPLHRACLQGLESTVSTLLEFAVDVLMKDYNGATPMTLAKGAGFSGEMLQNIQDKAMSNP